MRGEAKTKRAEYRRISPLKKNQGKRSNVGTRQQDQAKAKKSCWGKKKGGGDISRKKKKKQPQRGG